MTAPLDTAEILRAELQRLGPRPPPRDVLRDAAGHDAGEVVAEYVIADWRRAGAVGWQSSPIGPMPVLATRSHVWRESAHVAESFCACCMRPQAPRTPDACTGRPFARITDRGPPLEVQAIVTALLRGVRCATDGSVPRIPLPVAPEAPSPDPK